MFKSFFKKKDGVLSEEILSREHFIKTDLMVSITPVTNSDQLEPVSFPEWTLASKPKNSQYYDTKKEIVNEVFVSFKPYYDFIINHEEIRYNDSVKNAIEQILKNFISYFWDSPASEEYHHSYSFGLLQHSLEVACKEIEVAKSIKSYNKGNLVDSQATKARMPYHILGGFLVGLFHDAGKIFDIEYSFNSGGLNYLYNPFKGDLLDFYMCYPRGIQMKWKANRHNKHKKRNLFLMLDLIDRNTLLKTVPADVLLHVFDRILSYDQLESDHSSVANAAAKSGCIDALKNIIGEKFANKTFTINEIAKSCAYKVDKNYYVCTYPLIINKLATWMSKNPNTILQWIKRSGYLAFNPQTGQFREKINIYFSPNPKTANPLGFEVIFIKAALFDDPIMSFFGQDARPEPTNVKISREDHVKIEGIFYDTPLSNSCLWPPMSGDEAKKYKENSKQVLISSDKEDQDIGNKINSFKNNSSESQVGKLVIGNTELSIKKEDELVACEDVNALFVAAQKETEYSDTKATNDVNSILNQIASKDKNHPEDLRGIIKELKNETPTQNKGATVEFDARVSVPISPESNKHLFNFVKFIDSIGSVYTINEQGTENNVGYVDIDNNIYFNFPETVDILNGDEFKGLDEKAIRSLRLDYLSKLKDLNIVKSFTTDERGRPFVSARLFNKFKCRVLFQNKKDINITTVERLFFCVDLQEAIKYSESFSSVIKTTVATIDK